MKRFYSKFIFALFLTMCFCITANASKKVTGHKDITILRGNVSSISYSFEYYGERRELVKRSALVDFTTYSTSIVKKHGSMRVTRFESKKNNKKWSGRYMISIPLKGISSGKTYFKTSLRGINGSAKKTAVYVVNPIKMSNETRRRIKIGKRMTYSVKGDSLSVSKVSNITWTAMENGYRGKQNVVAIKKNSKGTSLTLTGLKKGTVTLRGQVSFKNCAHKQLYTFNVTVY